MIDIAEVLTLGTAGIDAAFKAMAGAEGLLHADTPLFTTLRVRVAEWAGHEPPAGDVWSEGVRGGGWPHVVQSECPEAATARAIYVDKISAVPWRSCDEGPMDGVEGNE